MKGIKLLTLCVKQMGDICELSKHLLRMAFLTLINDPFVFYYAALVKREREREREYLEAYAVSLGSRCSALIFFIHTP